MIMNPKAGHADETARTGSSDQLEKSVRTARPLFWFFLLGFGVPWAGWTTMHLLKVPNPWRHPSLLGWSLFLSGDWMSVAGFVATYSAAGKQGVRNLLARCVRARVSPLCWIYALFLPFVWNISAAFVYGATHGGIGPVKPLAIGYMFAPSVLAAFITGPLGEEAGWRGFLLPHLLRRYSPLAGSIILGVLWSMWHVPLYYNSNFSTVLGTTRFTVAVISLSILMTILLLKGRSSVLLAIVMHWATNIVPDVVAKMFPRLPVDSQWLDLVALTVQIVVTIVVVVIAGGPQLTQRDSEITALRSAVEGG
jgi:membrane protease YdiL (CAAX protease family)